MVSISWRCDYGTVFKWKALAIVGIWIAGAAVAIALKEPIGIVCPVAGTLLILVFTFLSFRHFKPLLAPYMLYSFMVYIPSFMEKHSCYPGGTVSSILGYKVYDATGQPIFVWKFFNLVSLG